VATAADSTGLPHCRGIRFQAGSASEHPIQLLARGGMVFAMLLESSHMHMIKEDSRNTS